VLLSPFERRGLFPANFNPSIIPGWAISGSLNIAAMWICFYRVFKEFRDTPYFFVSTKKKKISRGIHAFKILFKKFKDQYTTYP